MEVLDTRAKRHNHGHKISGPRPNQLRRGLHDPTRFGVSAMLPGSIPSHLQSTHRCLLPQHPLPDLVAKVMSRLHRLPPSRLALQENQWVPVSLPWIPPETPCRSDDPVYQCAKLVLTTISLIHATGYVRQITMIPIVLAPLVLDHSKQNPYSHHQGNG